MEKKFLWKEKWYGKEKYPDSIPQLCTLCGGLCKCDGNFHCHAEGREGEPFNPNINCFIPRYKEGAGYDEEGLSYPYYKKFYDIWDDLSENEFKDIDYKFPLINFDTILGTLKKLKSIQENAIQDFKNILEHHNIDDDENYYVLQ